MAVSNEEEAAKAYTGFADALETDYPDSARMFSAMALEESEHRHRLIALFQHKFGEIIPPVRASDVRGVAQERPAGLLKATSAEAMRHQARQMEANASRFYHQAASLTRDASVRNLLGDLAIAESAHERTAGEIEEHAPPTEGRAKETEDEKRRFVLQIVQPGLVGLMDGSVSTLAPVFAA